MRLLFSRNNIVMQVMYMYVFYVLVCISTLDTKTNRDHAGKGNNNVKLTVCTHT